MVVRCLMRVMVLLLMMPLLACLLASPALLYKLRYPERGSDIETGVQPSREPKWKNRAQQVSPKNLSLNATRKSGSICGGLVAPSKIWSGMATCKILPLHTWKLTPRLEGSNAGRARSQQRSSATQQHGATAQRSSTA